MFIKRGFILTFLAVCFLACSTEADFLKESNPEMFNEFTAVPYYLYYYGNPEEPVVTLNLTKSGKVTGDLANILYEADKNKNFEWKYDNQYLILFSGKSAYRFKRENNFNNNEYKFHPVFKQFIDKFFLMTKMPDAGEYTTYFCTRDEKIVKELNEKYIAYEKERIEKIQNIEQKWNTLNRNSLRELIDYFKIIKNEKIKDEVAEVIRNTIDSKVKKIFIKKYPAYAKYVETMVIDDSGKEYCPLYQLFRWSLISINPYTGEKGVLEIISSNGLLKIMTIRESGTKYGFIFKPYKNRLVFKSGDVHSDYLGAIAFDTGIYILTDFPAVENIDVDFLEKY